jgi:hypothetical protein
MHLTDDLALGRAATTRQLHPPLLADFLRRLHRGKLGAGLRRALKGEGAAETTLPNTFYSILSSTEALELLIGSFK